MVPGPLGSAFSGLEIAGWQCLEPWQRDLLVDNWQARRASSHFGGMGGFEMIMEEIVEEVRPTDGLGTSQHRVLPRL